MDAASSLRVPGSEEGTRAARAGFDAFLAAHRLAAGATWPFQVALDEVLSNIVQYASRAGGEPVQVELRMRVDGDSLEVLVVDDAVAFNPLAARPPDTMQPVETRKVGGLGLALVRKLMDVVAYERTGDRNRLSLRRRISAASRQRKRRGGRPMEIHEARSDGVLVLAATGRIDTTTSDHLEQRLRGHLEAGERRLVLDLAGVEYISSAGLRVLLVLAKKLQAAQGELVLCALGSSVRQVFELAGFLPIFRLEASREEALVRLATTR